MNRPDLHSAFTKINLWKQTQFRRIVYLDADVVAYRAPDELFNLPHDFSAAPDIGWPDLFNTGVMVLRPNTGDYYAMMAMAQRGISFDGADQGLLNMHFKNTYHRLSFTYNVTPSAHYQYVPAYKHFMSGINLVHFIGSEKPWLQGRDKSVGDGPFDQICGRWWAVYDRHYRKEVRGASNNPLISRSRPLTEQTPVLPSSSQQNAPSQQAPELVQYFVKGEYQPVVRYVVPVGQAPASLPQVSHGQHYQPTPPAVHATQTDHHRRQTSDQVGFHTATAESHHPVHHESQPAFDHALYQHHDHHHDHQHQHNAQHEPQEYHEHKHDQYHSPQDHDQHHEPHHPRQSLQSSSSGQQPEHPHSHSSVSFHHEGTHTEARAEQVSEQQRAPETAPPPPEPKVEPYHPPEPSWDAQRFVQTNPQSSHHTANKIQRQPPPSDSKPEAHNFPQTHYEMSSDLAPFVPPERYPTPPKNMWYEVPKEPPASSRAPPRPIFPWETNRPAPTRVFPQRPPTPVAKTGGSYFGESQTSTGQAESSMAGSSTGGQQSESDTPLSGTFIVPTASASTPWSSFPRSNAWDDVPEINRYVDSLHKHRRTKSQGLAKTPPEQHLREAGGSGTGTKVTDFPSENDRPSLPVTPAPKRRPRSWGGGLGSDDDDEDEGRLPVAEGVPTQSEWVCVHGYRWSPTDCPCDLTNSLRYYKDPAAQLKKLRELHTDLLERLEASAALEKEGKSTSIGSQEIPSRSLPFGSENLRSPTYVSYSPTEVISPTPRKPTTGASPVQTILAAGFGESPVKDPPRPPAEIQEPSYQGPSASFEKGEDVPSYETPAPPTEEELDVLET